MKPGQPLREDSEHVRNRTCSIFVFCEPLTGWCHAQANDRRTKVDWAGQIRQLLQVYYPDASKIMLVMDNLNTHVIASLYRAFEPQLARQLAKRLEFHYTPKHGNWLDIAEIEIGVLSKQCLERRISSFPKLNKEIAAWETLHNAVPAKIDWQLLQMMHG